MGNCFGTRSATQENFSPSPPPKRQKTDDHEQKYVTDAVRKLRSQADEYHQKVVKCATESQQAYKKGDKKKAHELSEEKKKWQTKQNHANKDAAAAILQAQKWQTTGEIDLHGLYLEEAMDATQSFLKHWSKASSRGTVIIITGAGHHSENHKAVIRPEVEKLLRKENLQFESVHGNGAFQVRIKPGQ